MLGRSTLRPMSARSPHLETFLGADRPFPYPSASPSPASKRLLLTPALSNVKKSLLPSGGKSLTTLRRITRVRQHAWLAGQAASRRGFSPNHPGRQKLRFCLLFYFLGAPERVRAGVYANV
jgi:hypothetical protein